MENGNYPLNTSGERLPLSCPECDSQLGTIDPAIRYLCFPALTCNTCGFSGAHEWVNPSLGATVAEARQKLERQKTLAGISGSTPNNAFPVLWDPQELELSK